nr:immunoglobulin light chain junction region [Macaca mulatta]MOV94819.1 immunoglobulin light chain junction region [Macaca mulatta]MOV95966.1 immunoglobulin light chain junction region [Macaca mulatta]MOV97006.1 immunoglobulin light chain junction region [Macaca mulatta]MOV97252.1 immunoglobulin light chain junction region [Macaca mulatta]
DYYCCSYRSGSTFVLF